MRLKTKDTRTLIVCAVANSAITRETNTTHLFPWTLLWGSSPTFTTVCSLLYKCFQKKAYALVVPNNVLEKQKFYQVRRLSQYLYHISPSLYRTRQNPSCCVDLGHHSTLVRELLLFYALISRTHALFAFRCVWCSLRSWNGLDCVRNKRDDHCACSPFHMR